MNMAGPEVVRTASAIPMPEERDRSAIAAICNRISRRLHFLDCEGLQQDLAIVHAACPLDLERLLAAPDDVLTSELMSIVDAADRSTGAVRGGFRSRFTLRGSFAGAA